MAVADFDHYGLLGEMLQTTWRLASAMRLDARVHLDLLSRKLDGTADNPTLATIAQYMDDAAASYLGIVSKGRAFVSAHNSAAAAATALIGATLADLNGYVTPLEDAATALRDADKSTVANAQAACNALLTAVPARLAIFSGN